MRFISRVLTRLSVLALLLGLQVSAEDERKKPRSPKARAAIESFESELRDLAAIYDKFVTESEEKYSAKRQEVIEKCVQNLAAIQAEIAPTDLDDAIRIRDYAAKLQLGPPNPKPKDADVGKLESAVEELERQLADCKLEVDRVKTGSLQMDFRALMQTTKLRLTNAQPQIEVPLRITDIPSKNAVLVVQMTGLDDDQGDKKTEFAILDPRGKVLTSGISGVKIVFHVSSPIDGEGIYKLVLRDADTTGNTVHVSAQVGVASFK
ncbi:hypothetical protein Pla22_52210 [Rubripirellula amarantea]|uniref:Ig-like domain-containing protein n=1 Tax=Rubripirellula amarantea TaxID=2527999 RepID=A0A5C5WCY6_9BACT|nr:hypothetical protein [Rubripirellula amarantea]TWT47945.1 hypothetical protein Pla22_52210 [Rubripirellula amarantea]